MIYIILWVVLGFGIYIFAMLHDFFVKKIDITLEDLIFLIWYTVFGPLMLIPALIDLFTSKKDTVVFKAKK